MRKPKEIFINLARLTLFYALLVGPLAQAEKPNTTALKKTEEPKKSWVERNFGMSYNSYFYGPGFGLPLDTPPGLTGVAADTGLSFFNLISLKWKFSERFALDVQFRNQFVVTNGFEFRHQGQRFGISGILLKGEDWSLKGAINSDAPIPAIAGQIPSQRKLLLNPGMFATFNYAPSGSRWSMFALLAPRMWFYSDRNALAVQDIANGGTNNKPEYALFINPSVNYAVTEKLGLRLGTTLEYRKNIGWDSGRRNYMPMEAGVTYDISPKLNIYTYVLTSTPLDDGIRRAQLKTNNPPSWSKTTSINIWLSGTLF
jgi:hypothetical protein